MKEILLENETPEVSSNLETQLLILNLDRKEAEVASASPKRCQYLVSKSMYEPIYGTTKIRAYLLGPIFL